MPINSVEMLFNNLVTSTNELPGLELDEKVEKMFFGVLEILKSYYCSLDKAGKQRLCQAVVSSAYSLLGRIEAEEIKNKSEEK